MNDEFVINLDQLRKRKNHPLNMTVSSDFLGIEEGALHFGPQVDIEGEAYIVDERLILHLDVLVPAILTCTICNGDVQKTVKINNLYHIEEIAQIKSPTFDIAPILRQEILLEVPNYVECREGNCPQREIFKAYMGRNQS